jgi:threonine aldolase
MAERSIDLRSDTVTKPGAAMRRAMAEAEVGDDVFGDDPTVLSLQTYAAELFGKEAGLYLPSGTMSNQAALHAQTTAGDEIFVHAKAHIVENEQSGCAVLSGLQTRTFDSNDGTLDIEAMEHYFHIDDDDHHPRTTLVAVEDAHNYCGGVVYPLDKLRELRDFCDRRGMVLHLDGARVCNAAVSLGVPVTDITTLFDSVSVCLSKGLGAPVGSVLLGEATMIARARRARKLFGGGMRQAGIIAAGGLYALQNNIERLADDHRRARALGERLAQIPGLAVDQHKLQTNMVFADTRGLGLMADRVVELLSEHGVRAVNNAPWSVRFVTHLDVDDADVAEAGELVATTLEGVRA